MGRKREFSSSLFDDDIWETNDGDELVEDEEEAGTETPPESRKSARQRLEDYFEMKQLRQRLGDDPLDEYNVG